MHYNILRNVDDYMLKMMRCIFLLFFLSSIGFGASFRDFQPCGKLWVAVDWERQLERVSLKEFIISPLRAQAARNQIDQKRIDETLFVIPMNDGEAMRALQILNAVNAPYVHVSRQQWGAKLEKEYYIPVRPGVKRIAILEIPGVEVEQYYRKQGLTVEIFDHHYYKELDRRNPKSSLEQLAEYIGWPLDEADRALAINDRAYIPGLVAEGYSIETIRRVRKFDYLAQGGFNLEIDRGVADAAKFVKSEKIKPNAYGVYVVDKELPVPLTYYKQELALSKKDGLASILEIDDTGISFSGNPKIAQKLIDFDFDSLGYKKGEYDKYGGGDANQSMFFGFKPKVILKGEKSPLPKQVQEQIIKYLFP